MNWINNVVRPKIRGFLTTRREPPDNFWFKCPACGQMSDHKALDDNLMVFPCCGHHGRMAARQRLAITFDDGAFDEIAVADVPLDPLRFRDEKRYVDRLKAAKAQTGLKDAVLVGEGKLGGRPVVAAAQDFRFMAGSLGMAAGEAVITGMMRAVETRAPFILFAASGGARMQEGILSLMQMPRTTIAVQALRDAALPYIVVLTDPTTGGVTASYAMLGDIHIAEPGALICFAGPRVIQQTIREELPDGFQRAEYLLEHGMCDMVIERHDMRETLQRVCGLLLPHADAGAAASDADEAHVGDGAIIKDDVPLLEAPQVQPAPDLAAGTSHVADPEAAAAMNGHALDAPPLPDGEADAGAARAPKADETHAPEASDSTTKSNGDGTAAKTAGANGANAPEANAANADKSAATAANGADLVAQNATRKKAAPKKGKASRSGKSA